MDSLGRKIRVEHDDKGRILGLVLVKPPPERERRLLTCRYDEGGNLVEATDPYRNGFGFRYDADNRLTRKTDRRGYSFLYEYDGEGRCTLSRGQDGLLEVRLRYDPLQRATVVTRADGGQWTYYYNPDKVLTHILDPYAGMVRFHLDGQGRLAEEVDPNGNVTQMVYDDAGGLEGKVSPLGDFIRLPGGTPRVSYRAHRVATCPAEWEYGALLAWPAVTPPASDDPVLRLLPQFSLRLIRTVPPAQLALAAGPPRPAVNGRHVSAGGRVYDDLGLLLERVDARGGTRRWTYDANGNIARYHDRDGALYRYEYESWNQLRG